MITREFDLMLYQEGNLLFINANQYDSGEQWIFTLYEENGVKYTPATGAIVGVKSDGKGIINTGTVDEYGRVVINETQQMTAAAGLATFELLIDNDTHGTANFKVDVEPRPADNADLSDSDLSLIQEAIDSAEVIVEVIGDSDPSEVIGEHVDAWLDAHPEATTTVEDGAITKAKLNEEVLTGDFLQMSVGKAHVAESAEQLLSETGVTDKVPYQFRTSGGSADIGDREVDKIVGGTIAWNQLIDVGSSFFATNRATAVWTGTKVVYTSTESGLFGGYIVQSKRKTVAGHKYYATALVNISDAGQVKLGFNGTPAKTVTPNTNVVVGNIIQSSANDEAFVTYRYGNTDTVGQTFTVDHIMLFDLTQMFGSTIADYIYSLEQANAGAGVALFRKMFPKDYYAYNTGELMHVSGVSEHVMSGKNLVDTSDVTDGYIDNYGEFHTNTTWSTSALIPIDGSKPYILSGLVDHPNTGTDNFRTYDIGQSYLGRVGVSASSGYPYTFGANVAFVQFCWKKTDDSTVMFAQESTHTAYEPYKTYRYPLDSTLTLRGIPKLSDGQIYYDGDTYEADGTVTRKYGVIVLDGSSDEGWQEYSVAQGELHRLVNLPRKDGTIPSVGLISDKYRTVSVNESRGEKTISGTGTFVDIIDSTYATIEQWKAYIAQNPITLVYELATTTEETAEPYTEYQKVSKYGTEEYVSTSIVPVGHDTFYPQNLRKKIEDLPKDFSTLIAPTEKGFTATRNYTVNDLLIVNNVLYKVTANIANGGTITVNTNVQQTTLSALIKALS